MGILDEASSFITTSWEQNTVFWIIISGIIGGIITQVLKFVFEQSIPQWQRKKATRIAIQKYSYPLTNSAITSTLAIQKLLFSPDVVNDENHRLSVMYDIGCFFGWIEILLSETFIEGVETPDRTKSLNRMMKFQYHLQRLLQRITSYDENRVYPKDMFSELITSLAASRSVLTAIGQLMIVHKGDEESPTVITIVDFVQKYEQSVEFKKWFKYIENLLLGLQESRTNPQWNLVVSLYLYIHLFIVNTSKKEGAIPSQWLPNSIKSIFDTVLWLPYKLRKYIRITRMLFNIYRIDRQALPNFVKSLSRIGISPLRVREERAYPKEPENEPDQFRIGNLEKVVVNNYDNLKYHVLHFRRVYPNYFKYYIERGVNESMELNVANLAERFLDSHFLHEGILYNVRRALEQDGYLETVNKPYYNYLNILEGEINTGHQTAKYWNEKGIVYKCLEGMEENRNPTEERERDTAVSCFQKAIEIDSDNAQAWNNLGLAYIDTFGYSEKFHYSEAEKHFLNAIEYAKKSHSGNEFLAEIYNNLGVVYYDWRNIFKHKNALSQP